MGRVWDGSKNKLLFFFCCILILGIVALILYLKFYGF